MGYKRNSKMLKIWKVKKKMGTVKFSFEFFLLPEPGATGYSIYHYWSNFRFSSNVTGDSNGKTNFLYKLPLTERQDSSFCK